jgi:hypothetical protein
MQSETVGGCKGKAEFVEGTNASAEKTSSFRNLSAAWLLSCTLEGFHEVHYPSSSRVTGHGELESKI